jgi:hypothetical protein
MVVVHRAHEFRFVIYTFDHEPAHVHITGAGHAKVNLLGPDDAEVVFSVGIKRGDMRRLLAEIADRRAQLLESMGADSWCDRPMKNVQQQRRVAGSC